MPTPDIVRSPRTSNAPQAPHTNPGDLAKKRLAFLALLARVLKATW